jgi:hypothetical protein
LLVIDLRDLYGQPLERFIPERNALAKELRRAGRRDEAASIAALRKPSVAAWAVNQLVRTQSRQVAALFKAGDALQRAHSQLLAGRGNGDALRKAVARERDAVDELAEKARGLLSSEGHELTPTTLERVSDTLHAAALDADARAQVKDGCLHRELRHVGLGASGGVSEPASGGGTRTATRAPRKTSQRAKSKSTSAAAAATRRRREQERAEQLSAARKAEAAARRVAGRTARELKSAQERRARAADSLRAADAALPAAREHADEAARVHRRAQQALERAQHPSG